MNRNRRGYSLIEMLVVIAVSSVVIALAVALLQSLFTADRATRDHVAGQQSLRRLADDFRDDAHAAVKLAAVQAAADAKATPAWELEMDASRKVRYAASTGRVVREETAAGKMLRREVYRLPDGSSAAIRLESGPPALAVLRVTSGGPADRGSGGLPLRIDAVLASDHRFAKLQGK